jgi:hypothetical protein
MYSTYIISHSLSSDVSEGTQFFRGISLILNILKKKNMCILAVIILKYGTLVVCAFDIIIPVIHTKLLLNSVTVTKNF